MGLFDKMTKGMDVIKEKVKSTDTEVMLNKVKGKVKDADKFIKNKVNNRSNTQDSDDDYVVISYEEALRLLMTPGELSEEEMTNVENAILDAEDTTGSQAKAYLASAIGKFKGILLDNQEEYNRFVAASNQMAGAVLLAAIENNPEVIELIISVMNSAYIKNMSIKGLGFGEFAMEYFHRGKEEPMDGMDAVYVAHAFWHGWGVDINYEKAYQYMEAGKPLLVEDTYAYIDSSLAKLKSLI